MTRISGHTATGPIRTRRPEESLGGVALFVYGTLMDDARLESVTGQRFARRAARLEGERELDEIQRIDRELVRERDIARQLFGPDAEMICYQAPDARLHEIKHTQPPPKRAVVAEDTERVGLCEG